ncbi:hypothetical protein ACWAT4_21805 [Bradyrhizobium manausense]
MLNVFAFSIAFVGVVGLILITAILRGWALSIIWGWFAVPIFGLPSLSIPQAIAVSLLVSMMTHQHIPQSKDEPWKPLMTGLLTPFVALLIGWIIKGYL